MKRQLLLVLFMMVSAILVSQTTTIDTAPTSLEQGEVFTMTASFDTGEGDSIDGNLTFLLRLYDTSNGSNTWVAATNVDQDGVNSATSVISQNITVPVTATPTADLASGFEYRLIVSYKRKVGGDFVSAAQVVTITEVVGPKISYSSLPTEISSVVGKSYGYGAKVYEVTWENVVPGLKIFSQLKDANGIQVGGTSFEVTTANGSKVLTWGFYGGGTLVADTNAGIFSQYAGTASISKTDIAIKAKVLATEDFQIKNVNVYPNPTSNTITIESKDSYKFVKIFDITGKTVKTFKNTEVIQVSELNKGIYFLKTDTRLHAKFVKI